MATIPITLRGAEKLKAELHQLKTVERPWVINAIAEARAQGDLSENAEYDAAKDRQEPCVIVREHDVSQTATVFLPRHRSTQCGPQVLD